MTLPNPFRDQQKGTLTTKWRKISRASQGPIAQSTKASLQSHIIDVLACKAEAYGEKRESLKQMYLTKVAKEEHDLVKRTADWVPQVTPNTDGSGGAFLLYGHSCDIGVFLMMQPHLASHTRMEKIKNIISAPICIGHWWLTAGWDYVKREG